MHFYHFVVVGKELQYLEIGNSLGIVQKSLGFGWGDCLTLIISKPQLSLLLKTKFQGIMFVSCRMSDFIKHMVLKEACFSIAK